VHVFRDPADVALSLHKFLLPLLGFPEELVPFDLFAEAYLLSGAVHAALEDLVGWYERRDEDQGGSLLFFYDDLVERRAEAAADLAAFMGIDLGADLGLQVDGTSPAQSSPGLEEGGARPRPQPSSRSLLEVVVAQTAHAVMASPEHRHRYSNYKTVARVKGAAGKPSPLPEALAGTVRAGGGIPGQGAAALPPAQAKAFARAWRCVVGKKLGFKDLGAMQRALRYERGPGAGTSGLELRQAFAAATAAGGGGAGAGSSGKRRQALLTAAWVAAAEEREAAAAAAAEAAAAAAAPAQGIQSGEGVLTAAAPGPWAGKAAAHVPVVSMSDWGGASTLVVSPAPPSGAAGSGDEVLVSVARPRSGATAAAVSVPHGMAAEHWIDLVWARDQDGKLLAAKQFPRPGAGGTGNGGSTGGEAPSVTFALPLGTRTVTGFGSCNLHGTWASEPVAV